MGRTTTLLATAGTVAALAACGSAGGNANHNTAAVQQCVKGGASRPNCQCAVAYATAHGRSPAQLIAEMTSSSNAVLSDQVAVDAGLRCMGH